MNIFSLNPFRWFKRKPKPASARLQTRGRVSRSNGTYNRASGFNSYNSFPSVADQRRTPVGRQFSELDRTRARLRWLYDNDGLTQAITEITLDNVVGPALPRLNLTSDKMSPKIKRNITTAWRKWCENPENCDFFGRHSLYMMLSLAIRAFVLEGESFIRIHRNPMRLEVIDPGRVPVYTSEGAKRTGGIYQLGAQVDMDGRITHWAVNSLIDNVGYRQTYTQHLSEGTTLVPVKDILHFYDPNESGSYRGEPDLKSAMAAASSLLDYNEAAIKNAKFGAERVGVFKQTTFYDDAMGRSVAAVNTGSGTPADPNDPDAVAEADRAQEVLDEAQNSMQFPDSGVTVHVAPDGFEFNPIDTKYPDGQYASFVESHMRSIASAGGVAYHSVSGDLRGVNFSSGRIGEQQQLRRAARLQTLLNTQVMHKLVRLFLAEMLTAGDMTPRQYGYCEEFEFVYSKGFSIDPLKKVQAEAAQLANGTISKRQIISGDGGDPDATLDEIDAEQSSNSSTNQDPAEGKPDKADEKAGKGDGDTGSGSSDTDEEDSTDDDTDDNDGDTK